MNIYQFNFGRDGKTVEKDMQDREGAFAFYQEILDRSAAVDVNTPDSVLESRAVALNNLAVLYIQKMDLKPAEPLLAEACTLYERLTGTGSDLPITVGGEDMRMLQTPAGPYEEGKAICLANAGALYDDTRYYPKAEKAYMGARAFYERLALSDPEGYNPYLSKLLTRMGNLYAAERKFLLAETTLLEAIGILELLVRDDPDGYRQDLVQVLTGLASLDSAMGRWPAAEKRLQRALSVIEGVGVADSRDQDMQMALLYKGLGDLYNKKGDAAAAKLHYERAMDLYTSSGDPGTRRPMVQALIGYASLCYQETDISKAKDLFLQAKEICESLIPALPEAAEADLSIVLNYLGAIYNGENNAEAEGLVLTRMSQLSVLHSRFNPIQGPVRADVLLNLAAAYARKQDFTGAKEAYLSAMEVFDWLENINPGTYQSVQAATLHGLGSLYRDFGHLRDAESKYNRSIAIRSKLAAAYPAIYDVTLARTYMSLGRLCIRMEEKRRAVNAYSFAVPIFERLASEAPTLYETELVQLYHNLAACLLERRDRAAAREVWEKALVILERLVETDPAGQENSLIYTLLNLANIDDYEKEYRHAEMYYKKAMMIKLKFRDRRPDKFDHDTAKILRSMGRSYAREGNWVDAELHLMKALHIFDQLENAQPGVYKAKKEDALEILEKVYSDSIGESEPTVAMMEKQLAVYQQLELIRPGTHGPRIAELLTGLAGEYADADDIEGALDARLKAHAIFETLIGNGWLEYRPALAESLFWLAILHERRKDFAATDRSYRQCIDVYADMAVDDGPAFHLKQANALMYYGKYLLGQGASGAGRDQIDQAVQIARAYAEDDLAEGILEEAGKY